MPAAEKYKAILEGEAAKNKIRIKYHKKGAQWGRAALEWKIVWIPTPARFASFFTGLHELGHIIVGHKGGDGKPEYLWEYEAFSWARKYCVDHGILVPVRTVDYEREIIAEKLRESVERGMKKEVNTVVVGFIHEKENGNADVKWVKENLESGRQNLASKVTGQRVVYTVFLSPLKWRNSRRGGGDWSCHPEVVGSHYLGKDLVLTNHCIHLCID